MHTGFWRGELKEEVHLENLGVDGRCIEMVLQQIGSGEMDWIDLSQDRGRWWELVIAVMNLRVP